MRVSPCACLVVCAFFGIGAASATATIVYSIEKQNDDLVTINTENGQVSVVASLGFNADNIDLTRVNGKLYGLDIHYPVSQTLYEINTTNGSVISSVSLNPAYPDIEALSHVGGQLVVGYHATFAAYSPHLTASIGDLALDGTIS
ncbi:hypothetical protein MK489_01835, partial [Myxococcota bacterium]|nr:hypothetical protein [Myxococcota bacterium]